jgi:hypothetical protein
MRRRVAITSGIWMVAAAIVSTAPQTPAGRRDSVTSKIANGVITLANQEIAVSWRVADGKLSFVDSTDPTGKHHTPALDQAFTITLGDGRTIPSGDLKIAFAPIIKDLPANPSAPQLAEHYAGKAVVIGFAHPDIAGSIEWRVVLREGAAYWRQELTIGPMREDLKITSVTMVAAHAAGAKVDGTAQGSPVVTPDGFIAFEHPMSKCVVDADAIACALARTVPLAAGQTITASAVSGLGAPSQLRRAVLTYLERERVHPYRPFLHYNSWYDLGYFTPYNEADALNVINTFGQELVQKRHVVMSSFLFDDGWDSHKSLWKFNDGFPNGFTPLKTAAEKYGAEPGVWMSPFGGYGDPRTERLTYGKAEGFETNQSGFALSGPVYYKRFHDTCVEMITKYGINQFKFDGVGRATGGVPGSQFSTDFEAAIHLIRDDLRAIKPDIFINLTTGTWPSPFWLQYADSIWRGGSDHSFAGVGTKRQQWITYRDAQTYKNVVVAGPLYPLNSLMLHGIIYAQHAQNLDTDPGDDFADEVHAYFGTGTDLQEMYVTPKLLTPRNWDTLAEAAIWARANADVLVDTHWIGGDPNALAVYGHAAWAPRRAIVVLRNPSDKAQTFDLDVASALELPVGVPSAFTAKSPWKADAATPPLRLTAGTATHIDLKPFQVLTLDLTPVAK